ncbi:MAG: hypothetical protein OQL20_11365 [Sedimenticola sp.]|nr:hypothetical protein [Sedimenticola sp.]
MKTHWAWISGISISGLFFTGALLLFLFWQKSVSEAIPETPESIQIVKKTTMDFALAVKSNDLSLFRNQTSSAFRKKYSQEVFDAAFSGFIQQNINLMAVEKYQPILAAAPAITKDGTLIIRGHYDTRPSQIKFDYDYVLAGDEWKISGINIEVVPVN